MKTRSLKKVFAIAVALLSLLAVSCEKDNKGGNYSYVAPYLEWGASSADIQKYMGSQSGWKKSEDGSQSVVYKNAAGVEATFSLDSELGFIKIELEYENCCDKVETLKSDIASHFKIGEWTTKQISGTTAYLNKIEDKSCDIIINASQSSLYDLLSVSYEADAIWIASHRK